MAIDTIREARGFVRAEIYPASYGLAPKLLSFLEMAGAAKVSSGGL